MRKTFIIIFITVFSNPLFSQIIKDDIEVEMLKENKIKITYDFLKTEFNYTYDITLYVSTDGGENFIGPLKMVTGDVGKNIKKGRNTIIWDYLKEIPFIEEELIFSVQAEKHGEELKKDFFAQYIPPLGARLGQIGKTGWYLEPNLRYGKSISAGLTQQLYWDTFLYLGAGVITYKHTYKDNDTFTLFSIGLIQRLNFINGLENILLGIGVRTATDFEDYVEPEFVLGIGLPIHFN